MDEHDKLRQWMGENEIKACDMARTLGLSPSYFSDAMNGKRRFSQVTCEGIEEMTGGFIDAKALRQKRAIRLSRSGALVGLDDRLHQVDQALKRVERILRIKQGIDAIQESDWV